jgi:hypothetical protein
MRTNLVVVVIALLAVPLYRTVVLSGHHFWYIIPNALLFTPLRSLTIYLWPKLLMIDKTKFYKHEHIPIVKTFAELQAATNNWRSPAIVRGLFLDTPAVQKWADPSYVPSTPLGRHNISVIRNATLANYKGQMDRYLANVGEAFYNVATNSTPENYLFFPHLSRFKYSPEEMLKFQALVKDANDLVSRDLQLEEKLWKGFGTASHSTFKGSQILVGQGKKADFNEQTTSTGTGWHCAIGNNYFVQVWSTSTWAVFPRIAHAAQYCYCVCVTGVLHVFRLLERRDGTSWTAATLHICIR